MSDQMQKSFPFVETLYILVEEIYILRKVQWKILQKVTERIRIKGQTPCPAPFGKAGI